MDRNCHLLWEQDKDSSFQLKAEYRWNFRNKHVDIEDLYGVRFRALALPRGKGIFHIVHFQRICHEFKFRGASPLRDHVGRRLVSQRRRDRPLNPLTYPLEIDYTRVKIKPPFPFYFLLNIVVTEIEEEFDQFLDKLKKYCITSTKLSLIHTYSRFNLTKERCATLFRTQRPTYLTMNSLGSNRFEAAFHSKELVNIRSSPTFLSYFLERNGCSNRCCQCILGSQKSTGPARKDGYIRQHGEKPQL